MQSFYEAFSLPLLHAVFLACFRRMAKKIPECRGKDSALIHVTKDVEGVGSGTVVQNCSLHVIMKGFYDTE